MSAGLFVVLGLVAWLVLAVVVALLLGAVLARRDRQRPVPPPPLSAGAVRRCRSVPTHARRRPRDHHR